MRSHAVTHAGRTLLLLALALHGGGCAQILGYDDLTARGADASIDAPSDVRVDAPSDSADAPDAGPATDQPPDRPVGLPTTPSGTGKTLTLAVKRAYLGTQTHLGENTKDAWREWGYDLDGRCTSASDSKQSLGTCTRADGSNDGVLVDGDLCRDNNFGAQVMTLVKTYSKDVESKTTLSILDGSSTIVLVISDVDPGDDGYVPGGLYRVAALPKGTTAKWDGTDAREVSEDCLVGGDVTKPVVSFPNGYVVGDVWVSGEPGAFPLTFGVSGTPLTLQLASGRVTIPLDAARTRSPKPALIVGAVSGADLETAMKPIAEAAGLCPTGPSSVFYDGLIATLKTYPDVVIGAPNLQNVSKACDAISVGLGFDLSVIQPLTTIVPPPTPDPSKCP